MTLHCERENDPKFGVHSTMELPDRLRNCCRILLHGVSWSAGRSVGPELSSRFDIFAAVQGDCLVGRHFYSGDRRTRIFLTLNTSNIVPDYTASIRVPQYSFPCSHEPVE